MGPDPGVALLSGCAGLACALTFGVLVGAVILRAAISIYNRLAGGTVSGQQQFDMPVGGGESFGAAPDPSNPFAAPQYQASAAVLSPKAVPEPDFGKACLIVFVTALINGGIGFVMGMVAGAAGAAAGANMNEANPLMVVVQLLQLPIGFVVSAGIRTGMLPTTFGRACLVTLIEYLIALAVALVIGVVVFAVIAMLAGLS